MYAKIKNNEIVYPTYDRGRLYDDVNHRYVWNPKERHYIAAGFTKYEPEEREGYYWKLELIDGEIVVVYVEIEEEIIEDE